MIDLGITLDPTAAALCPQASDQPWEDLDTWKKMEREIRQNSPKTPYTKNWKTICKNLSLILGHKKFRFCFLKASLVSLSRDTAIIEFENRFKLDHVYASFMPELRRAIRAVHPRITVIGMKVALPLPPLREEEIFYTRRNLGDAVPSQNNGDLV